MEIFSALLALCLGNSPATGEFPSQRPVTQSLDVFFDLHLNRRLRKQTWDWWFETLSRPFWRHCNEQRLKLRQGWEITPNTFTWMWFVLHILIPMQVWLISVISSPPGQNGPSQTIYFWKHFRELKICVLIKISLMFVPKGPIDNNPALVRIMACHKKIQQAIIWTNADPIPWRVYAAQGAMS